jgi:hypothetical protein
MPNSCLIGSGSLSLNITPIITPMTNQLQLGLGIGNFTFLVACSKRLAVGNGQVVQHANTEEIHVVTERLLVFCSFR